MNGHRLLADTNTLVYLDRGSKKATASLQGKEVFISFITEIELLGFPGLTTEKLRELEVMLASMQVIDMSARQKQIAIRLKQSRKIKTPDAIIAAASIEYDIPLLTADKSLTSIPGLTCILFEVS